MAGAPSAASALKCPEHHDSDPHAERHLFVRAVDILDSPADTPFQRSMAVLQETFNALPIVGRDGMASRAMDPSRASEGTFQGSSPPALARQQPWMSPTLSSAPPPHPGPAGVAPGARAEAWQQSPPQSQQWARPGEGPAQSGLTGSAYASAQSTGAPLQGTQGAYGQGSQSGVPSSAQPLMPDNEKAQGPSGRPGLSPPPDPWSTTDTAASRPATGEPGSKPGAGGPLQMAQESAPPKSSANGSDESPGRADTSPEGAASSGRQSPPVQQPVPLARAEPESRPPAGDGAIASPVRDVSDGERAPPQASRGANLGQTLPTPSTLSAAPPVRSTAAPMKRPSIERRSVPDRRPVQERQGPSGTPFGLGRGAGPIADSRGGSARAGDEVRSALEGFVRRDVKPTPADAAKRVGVVPIEGIPPPQGASLRGGGRGEGKRSDILDGFVRPDTPSWGKATDQAAVARPESREEVQRPAQRGNSDVSAGAATKKSGASVSGQEEENVAGKADTADVSGSTAAGGAQIETEVRDDTETAATDSKEKEGAEESGTSGLEGSSKEGDGAVAAPKETTTTEAPKLGRGGSDVSTEVLREVARHIDDFVQTSRSR